MPLITPQGVVENGPFEYGEPQLSNRQIEQGERAAALQEYGLRRAYYKGEQYEFENDETATQLGYAEKNLRLPEHLRKHAYSSHIQEAIDELADMLAEGVEFEGPNADLLNGWWADASMEERVDDWFREGLALGDTYARPRYDTVDETMEIELWEAEAVWPVYDRRSNWQRLDHWSLFTTFYEDDQLVEQESLFTLDFLFFEGVDRPVQSVIEWIYRDGELTSSSIVRQGFFDLVHARGDSRQRLRSAFGDTMISRKVRGTADRYNALEQLGYRVARQNSFSQVAVVGDAQFLVETKRDDTLPKDVADVWRFPGGTGVTPITLPTDPQMIEHQIKVLEKNLYREFGLTKTDVDDMGGLGTVSGYALEVLTRKDKVTHKRVRKNAVAAIRALANMELDVYALATTQQNGKYWEVDPMTVFPDREFRVIIGSGDIVDAVGDRDDFLAGIVSRKHVLRRKGLAAPEIDRIEDEINEQQEAEAAVAMQVADHEADLAKQQAIEMARTQASLRPTGTQSGTTQRSR